MEFSNSIGIVKLFLSLPMRILFGSILILPFYLRAGESNCENFADTKNKLYAVLRAYQCTQRDGLKSCEESLGLGKVGAMTTMAGSAALMGKNAASRIRNPDFILCPLKASSVRSDWFQELIIPKVWASACLSAEPLMQRKLLALTREDIAEIERRIQLQEKELAEMNAAKNQRMDAQKTAGSNDKANEEAKKKIEQELEKVQNSYNDSLKEYQQTLKRIQRDLQSRLPSMDMSAIEDKIKSMTSEFLNSSGDNIFDKLKNGTKALNDFIDSHKDLSSDHKRGLKQIAVEVFKNKLGMNKYTNDLKILKTNTKIIPDTPKIKYDEKIATQMKERLSDLNTQKQKLQNVLSQLSKPWGQVAKDFERLKENLIKLSDTNAVSAKTKSELFAMDRQLAHLEFSPPKINHIERSFAVRSLNPKLLVIRTMLGVVLSTGAISIAQANGQEENLDKALSVVDPLSLAMKTLEGDDLGGKCGMEIQGPYFSRDPEIGCRVDYSWNDKIQKNAAYFDDSHLKTLFKERDVCSGILKNFQNFYPTPKSKIKCDDPLNVNLVDGSSFVYLDGDYIISTGIKGERVGYYFNSKSDPYYSTADQDGKKVKLNYNQISNEYSDRMSEFNRLKALALSLKSCCNETGMRPSESECKSFGIANSDSSSQTDNQGTGHL